MTGKLINWRKDRIQSTRQIASIRETIHDIRELDDVENHEDHEDLARSLLDRLKSKQRNSIIEAALSTHLQSEALKPYQAELIKLQVHLEKTGQKAIWTATSDLVEKLNSYHRFAVFTEVRTLRQITYRE